MIIRSVFRIVMDLSELWPVGDETGMIRETGWNTVSHPPSCKGRRKSRLVLSWDNAIQSMGSIGWKPTRNMAHEAGCFTIYTHQGIMFCRRRSEHNIGNSVGIPFFYQGTCLSWDKYPGAQGSIWRHHQVRSKVLQRILQPIVHKYQKYLGRKCNTDSCTCVVFVSNELVDNPTLTNQRLYRMNQLCCWWLSMVGEKPI